MASFAMKLKQPSDELSVFLENRLSNNTRRTLASYQPSSPHREPLQESLVRDLNSVILGELLYTTQRFKGIKVRPEAQYLLGLRPSGERLARLNRLLLEDAYPSEIAASTGVEIIKSPNSHAFVFGTARIKVLTELELSGSTAGLEADVSDQAFARHLTDNFDAYAVEFPVLARLKELAKITAVAKYLVNQNVPVDLTVLIDFPPVHVTTPNVTPSIVRTESYSEGNTSGHHQMSGGVDMDLDPIIVMDQSGAAEHQQLAAEAARQESAQEWQFQSGPTSLLAKALPIGKSKAFRRIVVDHQFPPVGGLPVLALKRIYDSAKLHDGQFGPGWRLFLPFHLTILQHSGKRRETLRPAELVKEHCDLGIILLHDDAVGAAQIYRPISKGQSAPILYGRVTSQTVGKGSVSFKYAPSDTIERVGDCLQLRRENNIYTFDSNGKLIEVRSGASCLMKCHWQNGRLVQLDNGAGQTYSFHFDGARLDRVTRVVPSSGSELKFRYDSLGYLKQVHQGSVLRESCRYDATGRLKEVLDESGAIIARANYDSLGASTSCSSETSRSSLGVKIARSFANGRLAWVADDRGGRADFVYGSKGALTEVAVRNTGGQLWKLQYAPSGTLRRLEDPAKRVTAIDVEGLELISKVISPNRRSIVCKHDPSGKLIEFTTSTGDVWRAESGEDGRAEYYSGPRGQKTGFRSDNGVLSIETPCSHLLLDHSGGKSRLTVTTPAGEYQINTQIGSGLDSECSFGHKRQRLKYDQGKCVLENDSGKLRLSLVPGATPITELLFY